MIKYNLDGVEFYLKESYDWSWIKSFGTVFTVFAQHDSGNISFGVKGKMGKLFIKIAGLKTLETVISESMAVENLKAAMEVYKNIRHTNLIKLIEYKQMDNVYFSVFEWVKGDCLFDHWNFEKYNNNPNIVPPKVRFKKLPIEKRLNSADVLFSFLSEVSKVGYVAVDFYDGSILYDFLNDNTTICDIDFFKKKPTINNLGVDFWGTPRLKAPEEYILGEDIDERTNVFTLGALLFDSYFGNFTEDEVKLRYQQSRFTPCTFENWDLNKETYSVVLKAVEYERNNRFESIQDFCNSWNEALLAK